MNQTASIIAEFGVDISLNEEKFLSDFIDENKFNFDKPVLDIVNSVSKFVIKDKAGEFIGARMGRPEKAKLRKLVGSPNILFPVGREGGRLRSVQAAYEEGHVRSTFPINYCDNCKRETIYSVCENCGKEAKKLFYCEGCDKVSFEACKEHKKVQTYRIQDLDIKHLF